ncbi:exonuclease 3'-5' domain-containing protein 2 [Phycodurus eques]|uniref:exonuclease 3'-5' domain-containing protein 2 n=1 Tax=Phycodurus eques TaxID=693459 RepID=UPI002ACED1E1|nr:exonuclease 3'-5' domain-containing protein 2 [Phycodurus eques]XP_061551995.1 exonuclease 3'-5' domain-containing protein 2 [Phycodurus eques]XP_061551996.1 exonuclease 3'-5' domain-containing protein 2 [Phycodurus eques]
MAHRGPLVAVITTLLGATFGGLLVWRAFSTKRKRPPSVQREPPLPVAAEADRRPLHEEFEAAACEKTRAAPPLCIPSSEQLLATTPMMVSSLEEWRQLWPPMQEDLAAVPVLGLDCEWVSEKGRAQVVSLLQMASYSGRCVLVRLPAFGDAQLPPDLMEVLRDPHVLKAGVGCHDDGKRLTRDYGVSLTSTVDLRHLALRQKQVPVSNGLGLKSLSADVLNVSLDKSLELRCSDWEADKLTPEQMTYAARDAQVSVALFFHLLGLRPEADPACAHGLSYAVLAARCQGLFDVPFRGRGADERSDAGNGSTERTTRMRRPLMGTSSSPESGDLQIPDPRKNNKRKPLGVGYSARKSPLYDNCYLHAPDGQPLCTCDKKKAKWYLDKGIGVLQSEDPFVVRLLFEPSGRPDSQQDYYLTAKENLCVVCGRADSYIRKNIVPHEYRRHFPSEMKDHNSHDILLLCTGCHAASNVHDAALKQQLADAFAAPQGCEEGVRPMEDPERRRVRSAARALLSAGGGLPQRRRDELRVLVKNFLNVGEERELTEEELRRAAALETRILNEAYVPHGQKVVRAYGERGPHGLMELERCWRQHFLSAMRPKHLPPLWCVQHNHLKLLRKYGVNLPVKLD